MRNTNNKMPADKSLLAAIDLGSNSFRLEIGKLDGGQIQRVEYIKEPVRQGGDLDEDRNLTQEAIERGVRCLARFGERLQGFDASHVRAVATQTLREANNRDVFLKLAKKALGFEVEVISGVEEARLIYQGVNRFLPQSDEKRLVIDIGGRSTEFILGQGFESKHTASLHVGSVAWSLKHFANGEYTERAFDRAQISAESIFETLGVNYNRKHWDIAYGASGTIAAVADVLAQYGRAPDVVAKEDLYWLREELLKARSVDRLKLLGLREDRKPVIAGGLSVLIAVFEFLHLDALHVAKGALRHGLLYDMLTGEDDRLDLRNASVRRLSKKFDIDQNHANNVTEVALRLFEKVCEHINFAEGEQQIYARKLGWAAQLHEIGSMISPIDAHIHGAYILEHTDPQGFAQSELHCLSLLILGQRGKIKRLEADLSDKLFVVQLMCLRLAVILCHARNKPNLRGLSLNTLDNILTLSFPHHWPQKYPQSYYLLEEEKLGWLKTDWRLELTLAL
jgi:exopolyphosphatase/guanosine-5'-triphosphate,3'-diphosphate pyrophosphatase